MIRLLMDITNDVFTFILGKKNYDSVIPWSRIIGYVNCDKFVTAKMGQKSHFFGLSN